MRSRFLPFAVALILAGYFVMAVSASRTKSSTFDEIVHVTAGYNAWVNHDQRFDPGNGDFVKRWAALPLLWMKPTFPPKEGENWRTAEFFLVSREFMFGVGNDPDAILLRSRAMVALLAVALGGLVFAASRNLFGTKGGLISLLLFAFCPHMLAHGALVSTDLTLTLMLFASTWFIWRLLHVVSWTNLLGSLLAFSLLVISKMSAVLIFPIAGVLVVARIGSGRPWVWCLRGCGRENDRPDRAIATRGRMLGLIAALAVAHALAGWGAVWAAFEFKYIARGNPTDTHLTLMRTPNTDVEGLITDISRFCHQHRLLPEGFLKGMEELVGISQRRPSFMDGHWKAGGQLAFFPYAFWAKTPPALLLLLATGLGAALIHRRRCRAAARASGKGLSHNAASVVSSPGEAGRAVPAGGVSATGSIAYHALPFLTLFIVYAAVALRQNVNIGHRHILAIYPVLYVLAGAAALLIPSRRKVAEGVIVVLLGWYAVDSWRARPDYLAFMSSVVGGPSQGYRRLADSSLDWGQDLPGLKRWLEANKAGQGAPVFFSYFGTSSPEHYGIESKRLPGFPEWRDLRVFAYTPGYYAISATMFQQLYATTFGPWNRLYEDDYQTRIKRLGLTPQNTSETGALGEILQTHPPELWQQDYGRYEKLRFGRLCAWLRATGRAPDAQVGHTILIWKISEADLQEALWGKPLELYESPASSVEDGLGKTKA